MTRQSQSVCDAPRHAYLLRGKDGQPIRATAEQVRALASPLRVVGDPGDPDGLQISGGGVVATVRQIRQGLVVTTDPEMAWEEFSPLADEYLARLGEALGHELEVVEL